MPFQSEKQRRYLHANHPEIAKRWEKEYSHGGILNISEDEDQNITTDDGNDIELTAYNAEFDDPNDLSTGVKTLFMKKGGQAIGGGTIKGEPRGDRTGFRNPHGGGGQYGGGTSGGSSQGGDDKSYQGSDAGWENVQTVQEFNKTPVNENPQPVGWLQDQTIQDYLTDEQRVNEEIQNKTNEEWLEQNPKWQELVDKKFKKDYMDNINEVVERINNFSSKNPESWQKKAAEKAINYAIAKSASMVPFGSIIMGIADLLGMNVARKLGLVKTDISGNVIAKNLVTGADLGFFDSDEYSEFWKKGPTQGDNPAAEVLPIGEEIEAYTDSNYYMSPWDRIKANQAKRAMLVEKGIIEENNPIVDKSVTDITMEANKGGLANLFRVKN